MWRIVVPVKQIFDSTYLNFAEMMFLLRRRFDLIFEATDEEAPSKCAKNGKIVHAKSSPGLQKYDFSTKSVRYVCRRKSAFF